MRSAVVVGVRLRKRQQLAVQAADEKASFCNLAERTQVCLMISNEEVVDQTIKGPRRAAAKAPTAGRSGGR